MSQEEKPWEHGNWNIDSWSEAAKQSYYELEEKAQQDMYSAGFRPTLLGKKIIAIMKT